MVRRESERRERRDSRERERREGERRESESGSRGRRRERERDFHHGRERGTLRWCGGGVCRMGGRSWPFMLSSNYYLKFLILIHI